MIDRQDKPYDKGAKRLLDLCPQDFLDWLARGAVFTGRRSEAFQSVSIDADIMDEVFWCDALGLCHMEIQSTPDEDMEQRLLEYNIMAFRRYRCFVDSYVIFLRDGGSNLQPPLVRTRANGREGLKFHYEVILMRNILYEDLLEQTERGVWPLIPFARGGARREVVDEVIQRLNVPSDGIARELLTLLCLFAGLAFTDKEDQDWVKRRLDMANDFLSESPVYQHILEKGREDGLKKGIEEGIEQGIEQGIERGIEQGSVLTARKAVQALANERFPRLNTFVRKTLLAINEPGVLQQLIIKIALAKNEEEARKYLLGAARHKRS